MIDIPIDEAYLIGGWLASALWGSFTVLVGTSMFLILTKKRDDLYKFTTWVMLIMYSLATTHIFLALHRIVVGLIYMRGTPTGPILYLSNIGIAVNRAKDLIYITNLIIGDSIVVWRCYAVWGGNKLVVALPVLMLIGTAVAGYGAIGQYFVRHPNPAVSVAWGTAMFVVSFSTNVLVTFLTAGRISYVSRKHAAVLGQSYSRYRTVILLIIESGAIIAVAKIIEFVLFKTTPSTHLKPGNNALYIIFEMMPQITGILPTMIIVVVNAGLVKSASYYTTQTSPSRTGGRAQALTLPSQKATFSTVVSPRKSNTVTTNSGAQYSSTDVDSVGTRTKDVLDITSGRPWDHSVDSENEVYQKTDRKADYHV